VSRGSRLKEKINKGGGVGVGGWVGGGGNGSSKAFGISFADRPKAKRGEKFVAKVDFFLDPFFDCTRVGYRR
jgi:hypothetical protein